MSYGLPLLGNARSVRGDQFRRPNSSGRGGAVFGLSATRSEVLLTGHLAGNPFRKNKGYHFICSSFVLFTRWTKLFYASTPAAALPPPTLRWRMTGRERCY